MKHASKTPPSTSMSVIGAMPPAVLVALACGWLSPMHATAQSPAAPAAPAVPASHHEAKPDFRGHHIRRESTAGAKDALYFAQRAAQLCEMRGFTVRLPDPGDVKKYFLLIKDTYYSQYRMDICSRNAQRLMTLKVATSITPEISCY